MADQENEVGTASTSDESGTKKRAQPFTRQEVFYIVEFLEGNQYSGGAKGNVNSQKAQTLKMLSVAMEKHFGQYHSERQLQKRYSDLKNREESTYLHIKNQILHGITMMNPAEKEQAAATQSVRPKGDVPTSPTEGDASPSEQEVFLTLEPVPENLYLPTANRQLQADQLSEIAYILSLQIERLQSLLCGKINAMQFKILERIANLERKVEVLQRQYNNN